MPTYATRPKASARPGPASRPPPLPPGRLNRQLALGAARVQRAVRVGGGAKKIDESHYTTGAGKTIGSRHSVAALIGDGVRRVFASTTELEEFANGKTDYIGDVATKSAGTFWYRLPKDRVTVLGEYHDSPDGNAEDVILGLRTSRFMYESFNEPAAVGGVNTPNTGTKARLAQIHAGARVAPLVDRAKFNPDLENIVFKALTAASVTRNQFIADDPATMSAAKRAKWGARPSTNDYSLGERIALYLSMGIHLASDIAKESFGPPNSVESLYVGSARALKDFYLANQAVLDTLMQAKDGDDLIGIYELTAADGFKSLPVIKDFTLVLHEYGSRYVEQLGVESGNRKLQAEGGALAGNLGATLQTLSPAREEIMFAKVLEARKNGYLIVGMGDAHRRNLESRLKLAGIAHQEVSSSLTAQKTAVDAAWKA